MPYEEFEAEKNLSFEEQMHEEFFALHTWKLFSMREYAKDQLKNMPYE